MTSIHAIRFPVGIDAALGKLREEQDYDEHVKQLIKQVLLTNPGDRINRPDFGCGVRRMVFAPIEISAGLAEVTILQALNKWLGSIIRVDELRASAEAETLSIHIKYTLRSRQGPQYLNLEITL